MLVSDPKRAFTDIVMIELLQRNLTGQRIPAIYHAMARAHGVPESVLGTTVDSIADQANEFVDWWVAYQKRPSGNQRVAPPDWLPTEEWERPA